MKTVRAGVIGLGTWGAAHLATYAEHPAARLVAACDLDAARLEAATERYGIPHAASDYRDLLGLPELDAVSIVTPDFTHTPIVLDAVAAGKAVLVEKPLATTLQDCDRIGEALRHSPVPFMVDFHNRWSPGVVRMRQAVGDGEVGAVQSGLCRLSDTLFVPTQMLRWAGQSSVLWFLGSHCVDTLRWVLGDEVARLYSVSGSHVLRDRGVETADYYLTTLEFRGGARVLLENSWILPEGSLTVVEFALELVGENAALRFDGTPRQLIRTGRCCPEGLDTFISPKVHGRVLGFATESIRHFVDCVAEGREPMAGYADGREATRVLLAIEESANTGQPVEL